MSKSNTAAKSSTPAPTPAPASSTKEEQSAPQDPFANLPTVKAGDFDVPDLRDYKNVGNPRKYAKINEAARVAKLHMKPGWKYRNTLFKQGDNRVDRKQGSVFGIIQAAIRSAGAKGISAPVLVAELRMNAVNNQRSVYCGGKLPAIGWAEGYIQGAVNNGILKTAGEVKHDLDVVAPEPSDEEDSKDDAKSSDKKAASKS